LATSSGAPLTEEDQRRNEEEIVLGAELKQIRTQQFRAAQSSRNALLKLVDDLQDEVRNWSLYLPSEEGAGAQLDSEEETVAKAEAIRRLSRKILPLTQQTLQAHRAGIAAHGSIPASQQGPR